MLFFFSFGRLCFLWTNDNGYNHCFCVFQDFCLFVHEWWVIYTYLWVISFIRKSFNCHERYIFNGIVNKPTKCIHQRLEIRQMSFLLFSFVARVVVYYLFIFCIFNNLRSFILFWKINKWFWIMITDAHEVDIYTYIIDCPNIWMSYMNEHEHQSYQSHQLCFLSSLSSLLSFIGLWQYVFQKIIIKV